MVIFEKSFTAEDLLQFTEYSGTLFRCRDIRTSNGKYNSSDLIELVVASIYSYVKPHYQCYWYGSEYLQIIANYLRLNISVIESNDDWLSTLTMINNSSADYLLQGEDNVGILEQFSNLIFLVVQF